MIATWVAAWTDVVAAATICTGWIEQAAVSPEYLRGFTARHSNR